MTATTYPSANRSYRHADIVVHAIGLSFILIAGYGILTKSMDELAPPMIAALFIYVGAAIASHLASWAYHFAPWHDRRVLLRRIDHAAIYVSISGTFTPLFIYANTVWTLSLLGLCWALTVIAVIKKITDENVKSKWSTASYLALGAISLSALPDLGNVPVMTLWCIIAGALCYVIGTAFYARKTMPYRYSIWHIWVNLGAVSMFVGIWMAVFAGT